MCGRYTLYSSKAKIIRQYDAQISFDFDKNFNLSPGQKMVALVGSESGKVKKGVTLDWGFKHDFDKSGSKLLINARCETIHQKNLFKKGFKERRCVIISDGWYEWLRHGNQKIPYYF